MPENSDVSALARRYAIDINLGTTDEPDWQRLLGVREFNPEVEPTHEDDSLYEDEGWHSHTRTALAWQLEANISHRKSESGEWNAVHRHLRNSSIKFGSGSYVGVRYYDREGAEDDAWEGRALITWAPEGGEHTAVDRIDVTFEGSGRLREISNPEGEAQEPEISSLIPNSGDAGLGVNQLVRIHGHWFRDVEDVEFNGDSAQYTVVSQNMIAAVAPAGDEGTVEVVVTTAEGTSEPVEYEYED